MSTQVSGWPKISADLDGGLREFAADVCAGLLRSGQKELPSKYLYDDLGSALFEAITFAPEYGLTRADTRLLRRYSGEIAERAGYPAMIAELGSGAGQKTRYLLEAVRARQTQIRYFPIDVSSAALERCKRELEPFARVEPLACSYIPGIAQASQQRRQGEPLFVLFLGSTIGNFERACANVFLSQLRQCLRPGDHLLLGADLVKPAERLIPAYDDPAGVTAAFNLNLLGRVNRELGADFDLSLFKHEARYIESEQRIEMHLRSEARQTVTIREASCQVEFAPGETIWTESSHKFGPRQLDGMAAHSGFRPEAAWVDREWLFSECLWTAV